MIDVNQLKLTGTRFTYGTELLHTFNNTKKLLLYVDFKKKTVRPLSKIQKKEDNGN